MAKNPHYLSQMAHVELLSTNLDESVHFYKDIVGMDETAREEGRQREEREGVFHGIVVWIRALSGVRVRAASTMRR